jgi:hypothetical protein
MKMENVIMEKESGQMRAWKTRNYAQTSTTKATLKLASVSTDIIMD